MQGEECVYCIIFFWTAAPLPAPCLLPAPCTQHPASLHLRACTCTPLPQLEATTTYLPPGPTRCCFSACPSGPESPESKIPRIGQPLSTVVLLHLRAMREHWDLSALLELWTWPHPRSDRID